MQLIRPFPRRDGCFYSGSVPAGATIIVFASDPAAAGKGFSINGDAPEYQGSTSFRLKITDDTTISVP